MNDDTRIFKDALYAQFSLVGKALANPHRLELLDLLAQGERRVDDLARQAHLSIANASQHLQALRRVHLIESRREGTAIYYRLAGSHVERLWLALRAAGEVQLAEIDRLTDAYLSERDSFEAIDEAALWQRIQDGSVSVIDVRPQIEYLAGHIPGSRSMPISELESRLSELPPDQQIVAYCRGPYCVFADHAVRLLAEHGYRSARLTTGLPEWRVAGYPVETRGV